MGGVREAYTRNTTAEHEMKDGGKNAMCKRRLSREDDLREERRARFLELKNSPVHLVANYILIFLVVFPPSLLVYLPPSPCITEVYTLRYFLFSPGKIYSKAHRLVCMCGSSYLN